jgi:hypothetical protein
MIMVFSCSVEMDNGHGRGDGIPLSFGVIRCDGRFDPLSVLTLTLPLTRRQIAAEKGAAGAGEAAAGSS